MAVRLALALQITSLARACTSNYNCSLLGVCAAGVCVCDPGWEGPDCGAAALLPYDPNGAGTGYVNATAASWGGHPLPDPSVEGRWWLLVSEMARGCPLWLFENNSFVARAVSDAGPGGPYRHVDAARAPFSLPHTAPPRSSASATRVNAAEARSARPAATSAHAPYALTRARDPSKPPVSEPGGVQAATDGSPEGGKGP
jgi:hypothetical protein